SWQDQKKTLADRLKEKSKSVEELESQLIVKEEIWERLQENYSKITADIKKKTADLGTITGRYNAALEKSKRFQEWKDRYDDVKNLSDDINAKSGKLETKIASTEEEIESLLKKISSIDHEFKEIKWGLDKIDKDTEHQLKRERDELEDQIQEGVELKRTTAWELKKISRELNDLGGIISNRNKMIPRQVGDLKRELLKRGIEFIGPILENVSFDEKYGAAVESIFGERALYGFILKNEHDFRLVSVLRKKFKAFCNLYLEKKRSMGPLKPLRASPGILGYLYDIISHPPQLDRVIRSITRDTIVVEELEDGITLQRAGHNGKCVTLDGRQVRSLRYAIESPPEKKLKLILSPKELIERKNKLESRFNEKQNELKELELSIKKKEGSLRSVIKTLQILPTLQVQFKRKVWLTQQKNGLLERKKELLRERMELEKKKEEVTAELRKLESEKNPEYKEIEKEIREIPNKINSLNETLTKLRENERELNRSVREAEKEAKALKELLKEARGELERLQAEISRNDDDVIKKFREVREFERKIKALEGKQEEKSAEKENIVGELESLDSELRKIHEKIEQIRILASNLGRDLAEKEEALERIMGRIRDSGRDVADSPRPIQEIKEEMGKLNDKLREYSDVGEEIVLRKKELEETINRVKELLKGVDEELKEAKARAKDFKRSFFEKIRKNVNRLEKTINEKFRSSEIKASCELDLKGSFEKLGIGIKAALGGEIVRPISAMSGGQRTMLSICLMLGLQELTPSPVCIFDEAEMFLDKKNAHRVSRLVKDVTNKGIQFIMIMPDHSKGLIHLADLVIGVTRLGEGGPSVTIQAPSFVKE
ncbi:MAG: hypothetical protein ACTSU5_05965, partial [Promethearchaeota archaeon]